MPLPPGAEDFENDITKDSKKFTTQIRTRIFSFLSSLMRQDYDIALEGINHPENSWTPEMLENTIEKYSAEHGMFLLNPEARNIRYTFVKKEPGNKIWHVQQMLVDQEEQNDWAVDFEIDLTRSRESKEVVLKLLSIAEI
jgi:hypothetical protein